MVMQPRKLRQIYFRNLKKINNIYVRFLKFHLNNIIMYVGNIKYWQLFEICFSSVYQKCFFSFLGSQLGTFSIIQTVYIVL